MKYHLDPNLVAVWQVNFRFSTVAVSCGQGICFVKAQDNEPINHLYDRIFVEVDSELREEYGDYQFRGCYVRPAIMKEN
ncbi:MULTISPECIES: hypothetical protein [Enterobacteriaceae]|jgi:hypothetical protein|uniref:hypothetical protein n=1 Tax=Enterobacteriaceae TaxID=543 RepID=UPI0011A1C58C|nr:MULTISPECIES: hypothetical protein [Enterobacteriaceae]MCR4459787.1 hypothetical protein [Pseudescherichia sp. L3]WPO94797.1 hypothetical protein SFA32_17895 [Buttiauxella sp. HR94]